MPSKLPNYLKMYRKRFGLSQDDIAFLLGAECGSKASRYERFARNPRLLAILAFEVIFGISVRELFSGAYEQVKRDVARRAKVLGDRTSRLKPNRYTARKLAALKAIIGNGHME